MKEENKNNKKKVLTYYLVLAAALLIIAAVTVTIVLTVKKPSHTLDNNQQDQLVDGSDQQPDDNKQPDDTKPPEENNGDKPTTTPTTFCLPVDEASVSCGYEFAFDSTLDRYTVHQGMDFEASEGDGVYSVLDGKVTKIVSDHVLNENYITVTHDNGVCTTYKYVTPVTGLKEGDTVKRGQKIGTVASGAGMEMKQGAHLHFEVAVNGNPADPDAYLDVIEK